jgi:hypothetical protein
MAMPPPVVPPVPTGGFGTPVLPDADDPPVVLVCPPEVRSDGVALLALQAKHVSRPTETSPFPSLITRMLRCEY